MASNQNSKRDQEKKDKRKRTVVYSTKKIQEILDSMNSGYEPDMTPFFENDIDFRDANVPFEMTEWEKEEWLKCSADPEYFIGKYVSFQTDKGWKPVELREYQKKFIHLVNDEHWSDEVDTFVPDNKEVICLMARQSGKCFCDNTTVRLPLIDNVSDKSVCFKEVPVFELYYSNIKEPSLNDIIAYKLRKFDFYRCKSDGVVHRLVRKLLYFLDSQKFKGYDSQEKIVESLGMKDTKVATVGKYNTAKEIHRTKPFGVYRLRLVNGMEMDCADEHLVRTMDGFKFVKDLTLLDFVETDSGSFEQVESVVDLGTREFMFDLSVSESDHTLLTNGILSHNTTTVCSSLLHYLLFSVERNMCITATKGQTTLEIVNKLTEMIKRLPYFLKPGIIKKNQKSLKFDNGCYVYSAPASKSPATGFTVHFMYIDEAALIPSNIIDDYWTSVYPTLSSSKVAKIVLTSTPRGRQNLFARLWFDSEQKRNTFKNLKVEWWENPDHDEAWAEKERRNFGEEEFAQEYELQWDVAASKLIRGTDNQFMNRIRKEYVNVDIPSVPKEYCDNFYWHPSFDPNSIDNKWKRFVIIGDTAEGKAIQISGKNTTDYNVLQIFEMQLMPYHRILKNMRDKKIDITDCFRFRQVGVYMDNLTDEETMGSAAKYLVYYVFRSGSKIMGSYLDNTRILIEMNFNGKNFLNKFMDDDHWYEEIVFKTHHTKPVPGKYMKKSFGFKTTTGGKGIGKAYFCENGAKMITDRRVIVSHYNKNENLSTLAQLNAFDKIRKSNNSDYFIYGGGGLHDDLAYSVLNCSRVVEIEEYKEWIEDYFMTGIEKDSNWQKVAMLLRKSVEKDEGSMTDKEFSDMYTGGGVTPYNNFNRQTMNYPTFNQGVLNGQTYGTLMRGGLLPKGGIQNPYLGKSVVNPYLNRNR